jgi:hypothetical protein
MHLLLAVAAGIAAIYLAVRFGLARLFPKDAG